MKDNELQSAAEKLRNARYLVERTAAIRDFAERQWLECRREASRAIDGLEEAEKNMLSIASSEPVAE